MSCLEGITPDDFLLKPIVACGLAALANRENDTDGLEVARRYYIDAIAATNTALRQPRRVKEDTTLIAVALLGCFERLAWESSSSMLSWKHHVEGATQLLRLRGRGQLRTPSGRAIFREMRSNITLNALYSEVEVPDFVMQWSAALEFDPMQTPSDQLYVLAARIGSIRSSFRIGDQNDQRLFDLATTLERDLLRWSEEALGSHSVYSFRSVHDSCSPYSLNGTRHEYGLPQAHRSWNTWRCLNIILSRTQEAIVRRSWPILAQVPPPSHHYRAIRDRTTIDICLAAACVLGDDSIDDPPEGSIASGYQLVVPLFLAGTCLLEELAEPSVSPGGSRIIFVDESLHAAPSNEASIQLAWIIERLDYISGQGIRWAFSFSKLLKGQSRVYYDVGRSRVVQEAEMEESPNNEVLDLSSVVEASSGED
ncbi:hypothetical protein B0A54_13059 [Friedmanniomyces endolithicus]|uniref:Transcription factor domain-containing protein n=1 Tax=Friedmanniomyces endolithicus TaxID=329885 RepID=A0A4U0UK81_9PEZI|nr:hypothetical protein LTS09_010552 [Friedmanniomyces endolithicus]KAK0310600.1 hypothetical protein LTR01_003754 [Friedmanniomyces endolithicus]KAK0835764.1 hypothetical protein LTR73_000263 [Friedmanniomyces endolithicus]TKA36120.1 hypothetical protein B0A54_13059 [Friedmanniomyces endolithicus]